MTHYNCSFNELKISSIRALSELLIVKLPLSIRQLILGAIITESLYTKPIRLPILLSVASAHFHILSAFSFPSIIAISGDVAVSSETVAKSLVVTIAFPSILFFGVSATGYQPLTRCADEQAPRRTHKNIVKKCRFMAQSYYKNLTYERVAQLRLSAMYSADYENGQLGRIHRRVWSD